MQFSFQTIAFALLAASNVLAVEPVQIEVTQAAECTRKTQSGDKLKMHYRGTLAESGKQFDASYDRGTPFSFKLGAGQVIKGWDNGLLDMCVGEKRTLTIQPEYGYGARGAGGVIGPNAVLVFETELLEIEGVKSGKEEL